MGESGTGVATAETACAAGWEGSCETGCAAESALAVAANIAATDAVKIAKNFSRVSIVCAKKTELEIVKIYYRRARKRQMRRKTKVT